MEASSFRHSFSPWARTASSAAVQGCPRLRSGSRTLTYRSRHWICVRVGTASATRAHFLPSTLTACVQRHVSQSRQPTDALLLPRTSLGAYRFQSLVLLGSPPALSPVGVHVVAPEVHALLRLTARQVGCDGLHQSQCVSEDGCALLSSQQLRRLSPSRRNLCQRAEQS